MKTYCIFCETQKAGTICIAVSELTGCRAISPKQIQHTWKKGGGTRDIERDFLPGYIFLYAKEDINLSLIQRIQGVFRFLTANPDSFELTNEDEQLRFIRKAEKSASATGPSQALKPKS